MNGSFELFSGMVTDVEARLYAQFHGAAVDRSGTSGDRVVLEGVLRGPFCEFARTLPSEIAFRDQGPGPTALAEAVVSDPCEWSTDLPHWYEADVRARQAGSVVAEHSGVVGIRRWAARGRSFVQAGRRWVIRASRRTAVEDCRLELWREARMAMWVTEPDDALCSAATRQGIMLLADLTGVAPNDTRDGRAAARLPSERIARLAAWPAVGLVIQSPDALAGLRPGSDDPSPRPLPRNLLVAASQGAESLSVSVGNFGSVDSTVIDFANEDEVRNLGAQEKPVLILRAAGPYESPQAARAECDRLQRDMARRFDAAGYVV